MALFCLYAAVSSRTLCRAGALRFRHRRTFLKSEIVVKRHRNIKERAGHRLAMARERRADALLKRVAALTGNANNVNGVTRFRIFRAGTGPLVTLYERLPDAHRQRESLR